MSKFSIRNGYVDESSLKEDVPQTLRNRICNLFHREEITKETKSRLKSSFKNQGLIEAQILDKLGYLIPRSKISTENEKLEEIKNHILQCEWYEVYDFVEKHISCIPEESRVERTEQYNSLFEEEGVPFRLVNDIVVPIYSEIELTAIEQSLRTKYDSVNQHVEKALRCFSDRNNPDYENTIKEAISAVEAMCCIVNSKNETLNKALKHLKDKGVHIHPAMESAFVSLYAYTSDEKGIRHAGMDFVNAPAEDAKYMLVTCSAFINYLIEKWSKVEKD